MDMVSRLKNILGFDALPFILIFFFKTANTQTVCLVDEYAKKKISICKPKLKLELIFKRTDLYKKIKTFLSYFPNQPTKKTYHRFRVLSDEEEA